MSRRVDPICHLCHKQVQERHPLLGGRIWVCHTCFCVEESKRLLSSDEAKALYRSSPLSFIGVELCAQELYRTSRELSAFAGRAAAKAARERLPLRSDAAASSARRSRSRSRPEERRPRPLPRPLPKPRDRRPSGAAQPAVAGSRSPQHDRALPKQVHEHDS